MKFYEVDVYANADRSDMPGYRQRYIARCDGFEEATEETDALVPGEIVDPLWRYVTFKYIIANNGVEAINKFLRWRNGEEQL